MVDMMTKFTLEQVLPSFKMACRLVIKAASKSPESLSLQNAAVYAKAGLLMDNLDEIRGQIPYIQSNLSYWRGEEAQMVKTELKEIQNGIRE